MYDAPFLIPATQRSAAPHRVEETIQRSRFITTVARAETAEQAQAFVKRMRAELPDATHHCWAFVAGPPGDTAHIGMSDDGEPHGTAGKPMLTTLLHGGVGEVVAVCTRYYGGVKLGTGGLSRAYSSGVKLALESLPTELKIVRVLADVTVGYDAVDTLRRLLDELGVLTEAEEYGEAVTYRCAIPEQAYDRLVQAVADATRGEGRVVPV